jgi:hypothetical protein
MLYRRESIRNGPQHAVCYHTTVNAPAGEKTALAAVFMDSCSGSKEVDLCEMNKFAAAISHDQAGGINRTVWPSAWSSRDQ